MATSHVIAVSRHWVKPGIYPLQTALLRLLSWSFGFQWKQVEGKKKGGGEGGESGKPE
jgi:hypothetical protein